MNYPNKIKPLIYISTYMILAIILSAFFIFFQFPVGNSQLPNPKTKEMKTKISQAINIIQ